MHSAVSRSGHSAGAPRSGHLAAASRRGHAAGVSRRDLLRGVLAVAGLAGVTTAAGCDLFGGSTDGEDVEVSAELTELLAATVALGDAYDGAIARAPSLADRLTPMRDAHRTHAEALAQALAQPAPTTATADGPTDPAAVLAALVEAETRGLEAARTACLTAPARLAGLIGSMAAARACHLEVLQ
ncbi:MAG: hypothetical protein IRY85_08815 [Micromonosporaceae bacterium]|nr:hypothetical protein [Micromonosporaceae bacterium]